MGEQQRRSPAALMTSTQPGTGSFHEQALQHTSKNNDCDQQEADRQRMMGTKAYTIDGRTMASGMLPRRLTNMCSVMLLVNESARSNHRTTDVQASLSSALVESERQHAAQGTVHFAKQGCSTHRY